MDVINARGDMGKLVSKVMLKRTHKNRLFVSQKSVTTRQGNVKYGKG